MNRLDDMNSWRMFCEIVRAEGLNAACERLDCEPSTASRAIHALEKELGAPLFSRSSRPVKLTQLGHEAYQAALKLPATPEDLIRSLTGDHTGAGRISENLSGYPVRAERTLGSPSGWFYDL